MLKNKIFLTVLTVAVGLLATCFGGYLVFWKDSQISHYNEGLALYRTLQFEKAVVAFEQSNAEYEKAKERDWLDRFVFPKPNREIAALAKLHEGNALIRLKSMEKAKKAFKESITLNPGSGYLRMAGYEDLDLSPQDITRLVEQAEIAKYNLELLLRNEPKNGGFPEDNDKSGDGKQGASDNNEDKEQIPQLAPGGQPGKGGPDDI